MAIVCDGIGGAKAGEVASHTAVMTMYEAFMKSPVFEKIVKLTTGFVKI